MSRQDTAKKKSAKYDPICGSRFINMLVNRMMEHGKKSLAYQIFYRAAIDIQRKTGKNPISVFREALYRVTPKLIVKTRKKKKGKTYRVPLAIPFPKGALFGIRWLLGASRQRSGKNMASQLSAEFRDAAFKKRGNAIRKREQSHKMAQASRTFAHFRSSKSEEIPFSANAAFKKSDNAIHKKQQTHKNPKRKNPKRKNPRIVLAHILRRRIPSFVVFYSSPWNQSKKMDQLVVRQIRKAKGVMEYSEERVKWQMKRITETLQLIDISKLTLIGKMSITSATKRLKDLERAMEMLKEQDEKMKMKVRAIRMRRSSRSEKNQINRKRIGRSQNKKKKEKKEKT